MLCKTHSKVGFWGVNLVVDKTLRKLRKATISRDNDNCYPIVSWARQRLCNTVTVSRSARAKDRAKNLHNKETKKKKSGKKRCVSSTFMSLESSSFMALSSVYCNHIWKLGYCYWNLLSIDLELVTATWYVQYRLEVSRVTPSILQSVFLQNHQI